MHKVIKEQVVNVVLEHIFSFFICRNLVGRLGNFELKIVIISKLTINLKKERMMGALK